MPRVREHIAYDNRYLYCGDPAHPLPLRFGYSAPANADFNYQYTCYSRIEDTNNASLTPKPYSPVYHEKRIPSIYGGSIDYSFLQSYGIAPLRVKLVGHAMWNPLVSIPSLNWASMTDELASKLSGGIDDSWMALVFFKELRETVSMVRNPFNLLRPRWRKAAQLNPASSLAKSSSNIWLEYLYGWKSLYSDICDLSKAAASYLVNIQNNYSADSFHSVASSQKVTSTLPDVYSGSCTTKAAWDNQVARGGINESVSSCATHVYNAKLQYVGYVTCQVLDSAMNSMSKTQRFLSAVKLSNWQSVRDTLWEVIPFSFVVDWFVDSRGIWNALNRWRLHQASVARLGYSTKETITYSAEMLTNSMASRLAAGSPWSSYYPNAASGDVIFRSLQPGSCTRYRRTAGNPPNKMFYLSCLEKGLSQTQCASGVSLLAQRLLR